MKTTTKLQPGIDSRGEVGFANTIGENPKNGGKYQILRLPTPENLIAYEKLPKRIKEALHSTKPTAQVKPGEPIPEGQRNDHLTSMAGSMRRAGFGQSAIEAALIKENAERCQPPLPENEVSGISVSIAKHDPGGVGDKDKKHLTVAARLLDLVKDIGLFHTPGGDPYAFIKRHRHKEILSLSSRSFREFLAKRYFDKTRGALQPQAVQSALDILRARAVFDGPEEPVYVRLASRDGNIYIDLGDSQWRALEITAKGWRVIPVPPVHFVRSRGVAPLPIPQSGGDIGTLIELLNVTSAELPLILGWLLGVFMASGPYPVLVLTGEQGSTKTTLARMLRSLSDPSTMPLRALPREERDLAISASNSLVQAFDNVSYLSPWLSDAISRLATGGGLATRKLYTDAEEVLFNEKRPVILNGIGDIAERSDLLDRAIIVTLPTIQKRRDEKELQAKFERISPMILGLLMDAIALGLRDVDTMKLDNLPRMADFAKWVAAAIPALGIAPTDFLDAYDENNQRIHELALGTSPVVQEIMALVGERSKGNEWAGTATDLLDKLSLWVADTAQRRRDWPKSARALSATLNRLAPNFRAMGVEITRDRGAGGERLIRIRKLENKNIKPVQQKQRSVIITDDGFKIKLPRRHKADGS